MKAAIIELSQLALFMAACICLSISLETHSKDGK